MTYWLDYSTAKLDGQAIAKAGYTGVIRYIDSPANLGTKHTNRAEYASHRAAGLSVCLVMQTTRTASDGGWTAGADHATRAKAGADYLGHDGPVFFTNDRPEVPSSTTWRAYLDGAASVLGAGRVGAYGFRNAMDAAVGHATYFWQAGRRSDVAGHVHAWQDNNTQVTVGGITCDRNLILKNISLGGFPMALSDTDQAALIWRVEALLHGRSEVAGGPTKGEPVELVNRLSAPAPVQVDTAALVEALKTALAGLVADELARRLVD